MKTTKIIEIESHEILDYFVAVAEDCTISEARKLYNKSNVEWLIKEDGNHEHGNYRQWLESITIKIEEL